MRTVTHRYLLLFGLAIALTACPQTPAEPPFVKGTIPTIPAGDYFPLVEGSGWTYEVSNQFGSSLGALAIAIQSVKKPDDGTVEAKAHRSLHLRQKDGLPIDTEDDLTLSRTKTGVFERDAAGQERQLLVAPLKIGANWSLDRAELAVIGLEDISGPTGILKNCVRVRIMAGEAFGNAYFAKGVGPVLWNLHQLPGLTAPINLKLVASGKGAGAPVPAATPIPTAAPAPSATPPA